MLEILLVGNTDTSFFYELEKRRCVVSWWQYLKSEFCMRKLTWDLPPNNKLDVEFRTRRGGQQTFFPWRGVRSTASTKKRKFEVEYNGGNWIAQFQVEKYIFLLNLNKLWCCSTISNNKWKVSLRFSGNGAQIQVQSPSSSVTNPSLNSFVIHPTLNSVQWLWEKFFAIIMTANPTDPFTIWASQSVTQRPLTT